MEHDKIKIFSTIGFALTVLVAYTIWHYMQEEKRLISEIDGRLYSAAVAVPFALADDFHDRAIDAKSISDSEDHTNINKLSLLNNHLKTKFLYTVIQDSEGKYRLSSSSALDEEIKKNEEVRYFDPYPDVSNILKKSFENATLSDNDFRNPQQTYKPLYVPIFSDRWGSYRSVFLPLQTKKGNLYAVGADIDITYVKALLRENTLKTLLEFLLFLLIFLPIVYIYVATLKRKHREYLHMNQLYIEKSKISYTDPLTQIHNRLKLNEELQNAYEHYQRSGTLFGLVMIDIDHFKKINDKYGHQVGDKVLQRFAEVLNHNTRSTDIVGRWGGEEFIIIYHNTKLEEAYTFAEKLRIAIQECIIEGMNPISASFGVAQVSPNVALEQLIKQVDIALYSAKSAGRNCTIKAENQPLYM